MFGNKKIKLLETQLNDSTKIIEHLRDDVNSLKLSNDISNGANSVLLENIKRLCKDLDVAMFRDVRGRFINYKQYKAMKDDTDRN